MSQIAVTSQQEVMANTLPLQLLCRPEPQPTVVLV